MIGILGYKRGMTQIYDENGVAYPVTVVEAGPCPVVQVKTAERDGYQAYQIGFDQVREKVLTAPVKGHFRRAGTPPLRHLREVRVDSGEMPRKVGETVTAADFQEVTYVDVTATSKGRGFAGTIKRHGFSRGPMTHGSMNRRRPGSIGCSAYPSKVIKGKRMSGHMGARTCTAKNQQVIKVDGERNLIAIKGHVPGPNGGLVYLRPAKTARRKGEAGK